MGRCSARSISHSSISTTCSSSSTSCHGGRRGIRQRCRRWWCGWRSRRPWCSGRSSPHEEEEESDNGAVVGGAVGGVVGLGVLGGAVHMRKKRNQTTVPSLVVRLAESSALVFWEEQSTCGR